MKKHFFYTLGLLSGMAWSGIANGQQQPVSVAPLRQGEAPTANDYQNVLDRLNQAEQRIDTLNQYQGSLERLPEIESQLNDFSQFIQAGTLNPNITRSSDIHPLPPAQKAPTYPAVRMTGFFQADAGFFQQDTANKTQYGDIKDNSGFRRARLAAVGDVSENVSYMIEMDFAFPGRPSFMDVFMDIHTVPVLGNVKIGQWRQPFGMDNLTSVRELTFLERPVAFGLAPFRQTGIGFYDLNSQETITWAASAFANNTDAWGNNYGNKGFGTAERITALLIDQDCGRRILHAGVDHSFSIPGQNGSAYRNTQEYGGPFGSAVAQTVPGGTTGNGATTAGSSGDLPFFYNTGALLFNNANLFNAELAGVYNSFHWQTEATYSCMDFAGGNHVTIPAYYARAAYILTGEVKPYNKKNAVLGRIKPLNPWNPCAGGWGAFEVAAQYSYIDTNPIVPFQPGTAAAQAVPGAPAIAFGGAVSNTSGVLNWYLNNYTKFQFEYIHSYLNRGGVSSDLNTFCMRAQLDF